jgi:hypothetical protein
MRRIKIVLAGATMAQYPQGGGHWSVFQQYMSALKALGHEVHWIELFPMNAKSRVNERNRLINLFFNRWRKFGFDRQCIVLAFNTKSGPPTLANSTVYGKSKAALRQIIEGADILWNFHCSMRQPLLSLFRHRALLDLDPGHLHVSALHWDMGIDDHDVFFTVGLNLHGPDCESPLLEKKWHPFLPPIYIPLWREGRDPGPTAPITSVTQWTWGEAEELWMGERLLSASKRDAYRRYIEFPRRCAVPLELAVNLDPLDATGDREELRRNGWRLKHPHRVCQTVEAYRRYIQLSRAEFGCVKPIHSDLRTGWFSDRSAAYLASGRPVIVEDTGFTCTLPSGHGILKFSNLNEAYNAVEEVLSNYASHRKAARELAETSFDASKVVSKMLEFCT